MCPHCVAAGIACAVASVPGLIYLKGKLDERRRRRQDLEEKQARDKI